MREGDAGDLMEQTEEHRPTIEKVRSLSRLEYAVEEARSHLTLLRVWAAYCTLGLAYWLTAILPALMADQMFLRLLFRPWGLLTFAQPLALLIGLGALVAPLRHQKLNWLRVSTALQVIAPLLSAAITIWMRGGPNLSLTAGLAATLSSLFYFGLELTRRLSLNLQSIVFPLAIYAIATREVKSSAGGAGVIPVL